MSERFFRPAGGDFQLTQACMSKCIAGVEAQRGVVCISRGIPLTGGTQSLAKHNPRRRHCRRNRDSSLRHANGRIGLAARKRDKAHPGERFGVAGIASENLLITLRNLTQMRGQPQWLICARILLLQWPMLHLHDHDVNLSLLFAPYEAYNGDSRTNASLAISRRWMFPDYVRALIRESRIALLLQRFYKKVSHHLVGFYRSRQAKTSMHDVYISRFGMVRLQKKRARKALSTKAERVGG
jgi:hypothetical protein